MPSLQEHHRENGFAHTLSILQKAVNGAYSDISYMNQDLNAAQAIEYLQKHHDSTQMNLLRASQAFRELKKLAGLPEENQS